MAQTIIPGLIIWLISHIMLYRIYYIAKFRQGMVYADFEAYKKLPSFNSMVFDFRRWKWQIKFVPFVRVTEMEGGLIPASPPVIVGQICDVILMDEANGRVSMQGRIVPENRRVRAGEEVNIAIGQTTLRARVIMETTRFPEGIQFISMSLIKECVVNIPPSPKAIAWEERWYKRK